MIRYKTRILSTRPLDRSLAEAAAEKSILLESLSFIETRPVVDERLCKKIAELAQEAVVIVFTSMNAVDAVGGCIRAASDKLQAISREEEGAGAQKRGIAGSWKIFCIGSATQERVKENFGEASITGTADSAAGLADEIIGRGTIREVVFFCGDQRRDELPKKLWDADIRVKEFVVYQTRTTPHTVNTVYEGVVFFSPSAVDSFFSANTLPADTVLFAIGHTTADTIRNYCINPVITSDATGKNALIRQAIGYFDSTATR